MQPQVRETNAIQLSAQETGDHWFEYPVRVYPNHTDYGGIVWHGTYVAWMEEARVACLRSLGIEFADLVAMGCDLPVVEMAIRYHRSLRMGEDAIVKTRLEKLEGIRINWDYQIVSPDQTILYLTARVTLVGMDREKGKIIRQLPPVLQDLLQQLSGDRPTEKP